MHVDARLDIIRAILDGVGDATHKYFLITQIIQANIKDD